LHDVLVPKVVLQRARVLSVVRERGTSRKNEGSLAGNQHAASKEQSMRTLIGTAVAMLVMVGPAWSQTMSQSEISACNATWSSVEGSKTGSITQAQAQSAVKNFSSADTNRDGKLSKEEFTEACRKGLVTPKK
jgi:hypothetical protein